MKTAMQELFSKLEIEHPNLFNVYTTEGKDFINSYIKFIEMEKQQIIDCGNTCALLEHIHEREVNMMSLEELEKYAEEDVINCGEQYYNETFKKKPTN